MQMPENGFLLIKTTKSGFWNDMHHLLRGLLFAELTGRIPIVHWSSDSIYGSPNSKNAFEQYFLPVSDYSIDCLMREDLTFHPPARNHANLSSNDLPTDYEDLGRICIKNADVVIYGLRSSIENLRDLDGDKGNPLYGLDERELYGLMLKKYIKLRDEIAFEIGSFFSAYLSGGPSLAVHIRGSDKILEVNNLHSINERYPCEIDSYLNNRPVSHIFLMTDCSDILQEYRNRYGEIIVSTDCKRVLRNDAGVHYQDYGDNKVKGLEIIKDTWLAAKCDYFIGNGQSNVSRAVSELKDWRENDIRLLC